MESAISQYRLNVFYVFNVK